MPIHSNNSKSTTTLPKYVKFGSVSVREHNLIVGDCGLTQDSCPLSLDWVHIDQKPKPLKAYEISRKLRHENTQLMKPLSLLERRARIAKVQGITFADIRSMELERIFGHFQALMEEISTLLSLKSFHREMMENEDHELAMELQEAVIEWQRQKSTPSLDASIHKCLLVPEGDDDMSMTFASMESAVDDDGQDSSGSSFAGDTVDALLEDWGRPEAPFNNGAAINPNRTSNLRKMSLEADRIRIEEGRHPRHALRRRESFYEEKEERGALQSTESAFSAPKKETTGIQHRSKPEESLIQLMTENKKIKMHKPFTPGVRRQRFVPFSSRFQSRRIQIWSFWWFWTYVLYAS